MRKSDVEDLSQDGATGIVKSIGVERNPNDALINDSIAVRVEITLKMHPGMIYFVRLTPFMVTRLVGFIIHSKKCVTLIGLHLVSRNFFDLFQLRVLKAPD